MGYDVEHYASLGIHFLDFAQNRFEYLKQKTEKALNQIKKDEDLIFLLDEKSNSITILIKHLAGNMKSRWINFLTTDGEKPDRNRTSEFERNSTVPRAELMKVWGQGWECLFKTLSQLTPNDLLKEVTIRQKTYTVLEAIGWQLSHYSAHIGQIIFLTKHLTKDSWEPLNNL